MKKYLIPFLVGSFTLFLSWLVGCNFDRSESTAAALLFTVWCVYMSCISFFGDY